MFELWKNELQTRQAIENKLNELKASYKHYIKLTKQYSWNKQVIKENIDAYKKLINSFEEALKDY